jgi:ferredoxin
MTAAAGRAARERLRVDPIACDGRGLCAEILPELITLDDWGFPIIGDSLCVPKTSSTSCDQAIFVDQATDASVSSDAVLLTIDRFGQRLQRRGAVQGAVRPVLVVVALVLAQDPPQMVLVPDEGAVQELAAASPDPALGDRVHAGRPHVAQHGPDPGVHQDRVEDIGEVRSAVADHELSPVCLSAEVHEQVAGLLGL